MNTTLIIDLVILLLLLYYFYRGWRKGFLGTLMGPIALIAGCILSYGYYLHTKNMAMSVLLSIVSPVILYIILALLLKVWAKVLSEDGKLSAFSRLVGGAFSLFWKGGMLFLVFILVMVIPNNLPYVEGVHHELSKTITYSIIASLSDGTILSRETSQTNMITILEDPEKFDHLSRTKEYKNVMENDKIRELLTNPQTKQYIQDKNFVKLMESETMKAVLEDKKLLSDFFTLHKKIMQGDPEGQKKSPTPKVITINSD